MIPVGYEAVEREETRSPVNARRRVVELDRVRGLAIALMLVDHVSYLGGFVELRLTLGRLAMPLFFVLAGALVTRVTRRHAVAVGIGLLLPLAAPWAGSPNVLVVYGCGSVLLVVAARAGLPAAVLVAVPLALEANRFAVGSTSYDSAGLLGLMALGAVVGTGWAVRVGAVLPALLGRIGAAPLRWYVGNVLAIQAVIWAVTLWQSKG